jgi:8-oxo-dGTP pyrophosphatase MutT (NUDIX family)
VRFDNNRSPVNDPAEDLTATLSDVLLTPEEAEAMDAHGKTEAAVLVPIFGLAQHPGIVFTERRGDLRRHAGEISFPGGRRDHAEETLLSTALREAEEEIALDPAAVEIVGALPPIGTFVTNYKVHPFVGVIGDALDLRPNPAEVEAILHLHLEALREGYGMRRLVRRGVPFRTPTFEVERHLIWGATARILEELLSRLDAETAGTDPVRG